MNQSQIADQADRRYRMDAEFHAFVDICVMLGTPVTVSPSVNNAMRASATEAVSYALVLLDNESPIEDILSAAVQKMTGADLNEKETMSGGATMAHYEVMKDK